MVSSYIVPDYTVDIVADTSYLKITRQEYLAALKASAVERGTGAMAIVDDDDEDQDQDRDQDQDGGQDDSNANESTQPMLKSARQTKLK